MHSGRSEASAYALYRTFFVPGGPDEDMSSGFKYGGWTAPYFYEADEAAGEFMEKQMKSADLLLGRKTFEIKSCARIERSNAKSGKSLIS